MSVADRIGYATEGFRGGSGGGGGTTISIGQLVAAVGTDTVSATVSSLGVTCEVGSQNVTATVEMILP